MVLTCIVWIDLCDHACLDLPSNYKIERINLLLNMDHDELREVIKCRSLVPLMLGLWGWSHYEEVVLMFSVSSTLRHEHDRRSKFCHIDGF